MTISRLLDTSSRRTVREPLDSYSSQHGAPPCPHVPVCEQLRSTPRNTGDPVRRSAQMVAQLLVFALSPKGKISIQFTHRRIKCRAIVPPVILEPAPDNRVKHPGQVFDSFVTALRQIPATNGVPHGLRCLVGDRWTEVDEELSLTVFRSSRLKSVAKKIKLFVRVSPMAKIILAIDDFRFLRMEFQSAGL